MNARPLGAGSTELRLGGIEFWAGSIEPGSNVIELGLCGIESDSSAKR